MSRLLWAVWCAWLLAAPPAAQARARDLGIVIGDLPTGTHNAITDVAGVRVGHRSCVEGAGALQPGVGPVRTGVTVIMPAEDDIWHRKLAAGSFVLNGNGEAMGLMWIQESGILETPIALTNTLNVSLVQQGLVEWMLSGNPELGVRDDTFTPVVLECDDGFLNDIRGMHVTPDHVKEAIASASGGPVPEGNVGAGVGMITYEFKGGIGTASRVLRPDDGGYTVGVLLNANHGRRQQLQILGRQVGRALYDSPRRAYQEGSVVVIVATDAPLDARQLNRLSRRAMLGVERTGAVSTHGSGDVAIAFSTANRIPHHPTGLTYQMKLLADSHVDPLFAAVADAAEEAMINALLAAQTLTGRDGHTAYALPHDELARLLGLGE